MPFPLPQLILNYLEMRSTGGGFRGRATVAELELAQRHASVATSFPDFQHLVDVTQSPFGFPPPKPPPGVALREVETIDGRGNSALGLSQKLN